MSEALIPYIGAEAVRLPDGRVFRGPSCESNAARALLASGLQPDARLIFMRDGRPSLMGNIVSFAGRVCELRGATRLLIGEGIETSLSAGLLAGAPAWAALSAGNLARVPLPDAVAEVIVASDHDAPGQRAAWQAADAFMAQGRRVRVICPDISGEDFNDILQRQMAREKTHG